MINDKLKSVLVLHNKWLKGEDGGERADLSNADLSNADLSNADLSNADLLRADLRLANLRRANLRKASLRKANLSGADLIDANLSGTKLYRIYGFKWEITLNNGMLSIGYKTHSIDKWKSFGDKKIKNMDSNALEFWKENKDRIVTIAEALNEGL